MGSWGVNGAETDLRWKYWEYWASFVCQRGLVRLPRIFHVCEGETICSFQGAFN